jgi:hypothetical protein
MERPVILQAIINLFDEVRYMEIGVSAGDTFKAIKAKEKYAVDPKFLFDIPSNAEARGEYYFQVTSDSFFEKYGEGRAFDVIYIDGLHTYEQTLRDLLNSIQLLAFGGVIVIDDTVPTSYAASLPDPNIVMNIRQLLNDQDQAWMGDVYKLVYFVQTFMQQFEYRTISDNHGQIVMWRQVRPQSEIVDRKTSEIADYDFSYTLTKREHFKFAPMNEIIELLKRASDKGSQG